MHTDLHKVSYFGWSKTKNFICFPFTKGGKGVDEGSVEDGCFHFIFMVAMEWLISHQKSFIQENCFEAQGHKQQLFKFQMTEYITKLIIPFFLNTVFYWLLGSHTVLLALLLLWLLLVSLFHSLLYLMA